MPESSLHDCSDPAVFQKSRLRPAHALDSNLTNLSELECEQAPAASRGGYKNLSIKDIMPVYGAAPLHMARFRSRTKNVLVFIHDGAAGKPGKFTHETNVDKKQ